MVVCLTVTLMAIGSVFVFSASARIDVEYDLTKFYAYPEFRQGLFFFMAVIFVFGFSMMDYRKLAFPDDTLGSWLKNPTVYLVGVSVILFWELEYLFLSQ